MAAQTTKRVLVLPFEGDATVANVPWDPEQEQQLEFTKRVAALVGLPAHALRATELVTLWGACNEDKDTYVQLLIRDDRDMPVNQHIPHLHGTVCVIGHIAWGKDDEYQYGDFDRCACMDNAASHTPPHLHRSECVLLVQAHHTESCDGSC